MLWRADLTGAPKNDEAHRRAVTIEALHTYRDNLGGQDGISDLLAYAAEPVRDALGQVLRLINAQRQLHLLSLIQLAQIAPRRSTSRAITAVAVLALLLAVITASRILTLVLVALLILRLRGRLRRTSDRASNVRGQELRADQAREELAGPT